ncbi:hypothetical protein HUJ04_003745 [Dendroctonus ponderosae]|uniref:Large ribosomal subunit protein mL38 n=1 Tax=Dendroctonus ponderosae TaxID=77166 RepID=A0AAR5P3C6_DENPD|nr:hypothetical protein HUJ04_003745 [Dendroctonus ponderosae]
MSKAILKLCQLHLGENAASGAKTFVRHGHHLRGKAPGVAKSLQQKLEERQVKDPLVHFKVDIGLPPRTIPRSKQLQERLEHFRRQHKNPEMERLARNQQLIVDLEKSNQEWLHTVGPQHIKQIAEHYGVFEHLFGDAYFLPQVPLQVLYTKEEVKYPVYYGNVLKPEDASQKPEVTYESEPQDLWTLVLTNPDGHFTDNDKEYVHWFVANIPGNAVEKGETVVEYMPPFPPKGTGYHRHIFILYKQNKKLDFSGYKKPGPCSSLPERTFSTYDFYRGLQDEITPAGLAFFQADWSMFVRKFFHNVLDVKEPVYEYDFPKPYIRRQEWFPLRKPFNLYMDKYRDPKQINKEFLVRKLKKVHPFKAPEPPAPYPNAQYFERTVPTWLKLEIRKSRLKEGRINEIE